MAWLWRPSCAGTGALWRVIVALLGVRVGRAVGGPGGGCVGAGTVGGTCCWGGGRGGRGVFGGVGPGGRNDPVLSVPSMTTTSKRGEAQASNNGGSDRP